MDGLRGVVTLYRRGIKRDGLDDIAGTYLLSALDYHEIAG
jgi:hypothetical protein